MQADPALQDVWEELPSAKVATTAAYEEHLQHRLLHLPVTQLHFCVKQYRASDEDVQKAAASNGKDVQLYHRQRKEHNCGVWGCQLQQQQPHCSPPQQTSQLMLRVQCERVLHKHAVLCMSPGRRDLTNARYNLFLGFDPVYAFKTLCLILLSAPDVNASKDVCCSPRHSLSCSPQDCLLKIESVCNTYHCCREFACQCSYIAVTRVA